MKSCKGLGILSLLVLAAASRRRRSPRRSRRRRSWTSARRAPSRSRFLGENKQEIARGTAFALSEDVVVTNYHLVSRAVDAEAINAKGKKLKVEGVVAVSKPCDIALLKLKGKLQPLAVAAGAGPRRRDAHLRGRRQRDGPDRRLRGDDPGIPRARARPEMHGRLPGRPAVVLGKPRHGPRRPGHRRRPGARTAEERHPGERVRGPRRLGEAHAPQGHGPRGLFRGARGRLPRRQARRDDGRDHGRPDVPGKGRRPGSLARRGLRPPRLRLLGARRTSPPRRRPTARSSPSTRGASPLITASGRSTTACSAIADAVAALEKAVSLDPNRADAFLDLGHGLRGFQGFRPGRRGL